MSPEAWAFLGTTVAALAGVVVALIQSRRRDETVKKAAQDAQASAHTVAVTAQAVAGTAEAVAEELRPNGGASLRDAIDRVENNQKLQWRAIRDQGERIARIEGSVDTLTRRSG